MVPSGSTRVATTLISPFCHRHNAVAVANLNWSLACDNVRRPAVNNGVTAVTHTAENGNQLLAFAQLNAVEIWCQGRVELPTLRFRLGPSIDDGRSVMIWSQCGPQALSFF
jgi:hypothetical protein